MTDSSKGVFSASISLLPPSVNKMYVYTTRGPRPSAAMRKFRSKAAMELLSQVPFDMDPLNPNKPHKLTIEFYLPVLVNKGWPKKAKTRFRRRDVSNLVKVVEDLVSQALGIDDSCFIRIEISKADGGKHNYEGIKFWIEELSDEY